jgi:SAM-dependent methyltransferase
MSQAIATLRRHVGPVRLRKTWRLRVVKTRFGTETMRDWLLDRRYGGWCGGTSRSEFPELGALGMSSISYSHLRKIFSAENGVDMSRDGVLVDIGCGKGRVLNCWLDQGLENRLIGIELIERYATFARERLGERPQVDVRCTDAIADLPAEASLMFLFNPFWRTAMERFRDRVAELYAPGHPLVIVYYNSVFSDVFESDPRFVVEPFHTHVFHPGVLVRLAG